MIIFTSILILAQSQLWTFVTQLPFSAWQIFSILAWKKGSKASNFEFNVSSIFLLNMLACIVTCSHAENGNCVKKTNLEQLNI